MDTACPAIICSRNLSPGVLTYLGYSSGDKTTLSLTCNLIISYSRSDEKSTITYGAAVRVSQLFSRRSRKTMRTNGGNHPCMETASHARARITYVCVGFGCAVLEIFCTQDRICTGIGSGLLFLSHTCPACNLLQHTGLQSDGPDFCADVTASIKDWSSGWDPRA